MVVLTDMIKGIYNVGYSIWNYLIGIAITLFTTSPTAASGAVYTITYSLFLSISSISIPICIIFFLLAIFKDVIGTPPEQQLKQFLLDALKFCVVVGIVANLWTVMGYIMQVADGVTNALAGSTSHTLSLSTELINVITQATTLPPAPAGDLASILQYLLDILVFTFTVLLFFLASLATLIIIIGSGISIISSGFQRIIKPLVFLPFSSISVAMAAGSGEASRAATQYLKTFFGLCLSGAFMVVSVKLGVALSNGLIVFNYASLTIHEQIIFISVQNAITPIVIAGLIKSSDSMIGRMF